MRCAASASPSCARLSAPPPRPPLHRPALAWMSVLLVAETIGHGTTARLVAAIGARTMGGIATLGTGTTGAAFLVPLVVADVVQARRSRQRRPPGRSWPRWYAFFVTTFRCERLLPNCSFRALRSSCVLTARIMLTQLAQIAGENMMIATSVSAARALPNGQLPLPDVRPPLSYCVVEADPLMYFLLCSFSIQGKQIVLHLVGLKWSRVRFSLFRLFIIHHPTSHSKGNRSTC
jgi:hypothetical protein